MRYMIGVVLGLMGALAVVAQTLGSGLSDQMQAADIVILGEIHDNPAHHRGQAALIERLAPKAVVFEMLTPLMATQVNARTGEDLGALGSEIGWEEAGWPDFGIYLPIFEALGGAQVVGAALPRGTARQAFGAGAAAIFEGDAERFGLTTPLPEKEDTARRQMQFSAHCEAMPLEMMGGMVEAQRLRDAHFAARTLLALKAHGGPVAVITGNGHARKDWGMPYALALAAPDAQVLSIGFVEAPAEPNDRRFDVTLVTPAAERGDPCAAFN